MKVVAVLLAAGEGARTNSNTPKQLLKFGNKFLFEYALVSLQKGFSYKKIILMASTKTFLKIKKTSVKYKNVDVVIGAETRFETIKRAVEYVAQHCHGCDLILFQDAVRPYIKMSLYKKIINSSIGADGSILVQDLRGSIPIKIRNEQIYAYDTGYYFASHSPECYRFDTLRSLIKKTGVKTKKMTNLELMLKYNKKIVPILSNTPNIKVTFPEDIDFTKKYLLKEGERHNK